MTTTIIEFLVAGWLSYWIFKVPNVIWGKTAIETQMQFWQENWKLFLLSLGGLLAMIFNGNAIPDTWGKINGPVPAFLTGGSIPSIVMNAIPVLQKAWGIFFVNRNQN